MINGAQSTAASSISVAYFYCKHGDGTRDSCDAVFRGILAQLLAQNPDIIPYFSLHQLELIRDPLKSDGLRSLVKTIFEVLDLVYLVVDGLDEIGQGEREKFFSFIVPLVRSQLGGDTGDNIKLFISSRGEDDIRKSIYSIGRTSRKSYEIAGGDNCDDIAFYVFLRVQELQNKFGFDNSRREEISRQVCGRAGGAYSHCHVRDRRPIANPNLYFGWPIVMFLLAKLILDNLVNQASLEELDEEMRPEILPSELRNA